MAAVAAPLFWLGPIGWIAGGSFILGGILLAKKHHDDHNLPKLHDNGNHGNPNNKDPNGNPINPYYYHTIMARSRKDAMERARRAGFGTRPILDGDHFHVGKFRGGKLFKFGNTHFKWPF